MTILRIVGDGTYTGSRVETDAGEQIMGVTSVKLEMGRPDNQIAQVTITLRRFKLDLQRDTDGIAIGTLGAPAGDVDGDRRIMGFSTVPPLTEAEEEAIARYMRENPPPPLSVPC